MALAFESRQKQNNAYFVHSPIGFDLSNYGQQLLHERDERTLNLRRRGSFSYLSCAEIKANGSCDCQMDNFFTVKKPHTWHGCQISDEAVLTPEKVTIFLSEAVELAPEMRSDKISVLNVLPKCDKSIVTMIACDANVCDAIVSCITSGTMLINDQFLLINTVAFLFPFSNEETQMKYADDLLLCFQCLINDPNYTELILLLINVFAKSSSYAKDSMICFGLNSFLIDFLRNNSQCNNTNNNTNNNNTLINLTCLAISSMFTNPSDLNDSVIAESLSQFVEFLNLEIIDNNIMIIGCALECLISLTNHKPSLTLILSARIGFPLKIMGFLDTPILTSLSLQLIGNLTNSQPSTCRTMLENGLFQKLMILINAEELTADIFWILSNIFFIIPQIFSQFITSEFIESTVNLCQNTKSDIKKEAVFFLSSFIVNTKPLEKIKSYVNNEIIFLIDEMFSCGDEKVVNVCACAMYLMIDALASSDEDLMRVVQACVEECQMLQDLEEVADDIKDSNVRLRVQALIYKLQKLCEIVE